MAHRPNINGPLAWSLLFIGGTALLLLVMLPPLVGAAFGPSATSDAVAEEFTRYMATHDQKLAMHRERFNGRSIFFKPPAIRKPTQVVDRKPTPPPPVERKPVESKPKDPPPRKKPPWSGPNIKTMIGGEVWFDNGLRLKMGEEKDGMEVIAVDPPWSATIRKGEWEYERPFFERATETLFGAADNAKVSQPTGFIESDDEATARAERAARDSARASRSAPRPAASSSRSRPKRGRQGDDDEQDRGAPDE
ncbi:MAG: hypothetical protein ACYTGP_03335 [Planctomycetota bacterium]|jgi:hypothetical protein